MNQIFNVEGMTCGHCEKAITKALLALDADAKIVIDRLAQRVEVDSRQDRKALEQVITDEGYRIVEASDGREALKKLGEEAIDLCVLDVMMPNMDGFTLAEEIRDVDPDIPLFFLSAKTMKEDVIQGYKLGADDYITKPFDSEVLLLKIKAILKRNELVWGWGRAHHPAHFDRVSFCCRGELAHGEDFTNYFLVTPTILAIFSMFSASFK